MFSFDITKVTLGEATNLACKVTDVYPRATISFVLPDGNKVDTKLVNFTDMSPKTPYFMYTEQASFDFTPVHSDFGKNLSCHVFSIGSTNLTIEKSLTLDVSGFSLLPEQCQGKST